MKSGCRTGPTKPCLTQWWEEFSFLWWPVASKQVCQSRFVWTTRHLTQTAFPALLFCCFSRLVPHSLSVRGPHMPGSWLDPATSTPSFLFNWPGSQVNGEEIQIRGHRPLAQLHRSPKGIGCQEVNFSERRKGRGHTRVSALTHFLFLFLPFLLMLC